jgi:hypothetical protein
MSQKRQPDIIAKEKLKYIPAKKGKQNFKPVNLPIHR